MLGLISSDTYNEKQIQRCIKYIRRKKIWWFNTSKLEYKGCFVIITPAFDWEAKAKIKRSKLLLILEEFHQFILSPKKAKKGNN